ncbi:hypothetical protein WJT86_10105 [Microvirga sp. W0021]|uniref:Uncharacterized protein n=1 Tax=Hohaiivirga grylli TaxID=3133970 RepID=A0ABV0BK88_9HYPH
MSFSKATLIEQALNNLGVLGAGQPVEAEDYAKLDRILKSTVAVLAAQKIIYLEAEYDADEFPDELLLPLAQILASNAASAYQLGGSDVMAARQIALEAEFNIRAMSETERGSQPTPALYF